MGLSVSTRPALEVASGDLQLFVCSPHSTELEVDRATGVIEVRLFLPCGTSSTNHKYSYGRSHTQRLPSLGFHRGSLCARPEGVRVRCRFRRFADLCLSLYEMIAGYNSFVQQITNSICRNQSRRGNAPIGRPEAVPFDKAFLMFERFLADLNSAGGRLVLLLLVFLFCSIGSAFGVPGLRLGTIATLSTLLLVLRRSDSPRGSRIGNAIVSLVKKLQPRSSPSTESIVTKVASVN